VPLLACPAVHGTGPRPHRFTHSGHSTIRMLFASIRGAFFRVTGVVTAFTTVEAIFSIFGRSRSRPAPRRAWRRLRTQHPQLISISRASNFLQSGSSLHGFNIAAVDLYPIGRSSSEKAIFSGCFLDPPDEPVRIHEFRVDEVGPEPLQIRPEREDR